MARFQKGQPSANPLGRGFSTATKAAARSAPGHDGVIAYSGFVQQGEGSSKLTGSQKWIEYANAYSFPPVAIRAMLQSALFAGVKWTLAENSAGGSDAQRGVEIVDEGLLKARLPRPFSKVAAKGGLSWLTGFSIHAIALGRRKDGMVVFTDLAHRPPHTIWQWWREGKGATGPFVSVTQRTADGQTADIPLDECLYLVNDTFGDDPGGVGMLRLVIERIRRADKYEALEMTEAFSSMGGMPIPRAPLEEIAGSAKGTATEKAASITAATSELRRVVGERIQTPEHQPYMMLDSATYKGANPDSISGIKKWDVEIVKGELQGLPEIRKIISDLTLDVARMLGVEFAFVGGGDSAGSFGMHESKVSMLAASLSSMLSEIAECATQQLARRLVVANGLDPDTATPTLVPSPISTEDVEKAARTLGLINMAGLPANHPAKIALFDRMNLPWEDESDAPLMLPRGGGFGGGGSANDVPAEPPTDAAPAPKEAP